MFEINITSNSKIDSEARGNGKVGYIKCDFFYLGEKY